MKWLYISALIIALGIMGYVYVGLNKTPAETAVVATSTAPVESINIAHAFKDGEHRFIGQVRLPDSCYSFNAEAVHDQKRQNVITIVLNASDKKIEQSQCSQLPTYYPFQVLSDGAEDATIEATLNGEKIDIVIKDTAWQSSTGTYFNPISN